MKKIKKLRTCCSGGTFLLIRLLCVSFIFLLLYAAFGYAAPNEYILLDQSFIGNDVTGLSVRPIKEINESIVTLERLVTKEPNNVDFYSLLAKNYYHLYQFEKATNIAHHALAIDPENSTLFCLLGQIDEAMGKNDESIEYFRQCVTYDYLNAEPHILLARAYIKNGRYVLATRALEKALEICPTSGLAYYYQGLLHVRTQEFKEALVDFKDALTYRPDLYQAALNVGAIYYTLNNQERALAYFRKAIEINRAYELGNFNLGALLLHKGRYREARERLKKSLEINQKREMTYFLLGIINEHLGDVDQSIEMFEKVVKLFPDKKNYLLILGELHAKNKRYEFAQRYYSIFIKKEKDLNPYVLVRYGLILEKLGRYQEAKAMYRRAITERPTYSKAHFLLFKQYLFSFQLKAAYGQLLKSGTYLYTSIMIIILVFFFFLVVSLALRIFASHGH